MLFNLRGDDSFSTPPNIALRDPALPYALSCTTLLYPALRCPNLHCTALHCTVLPFTALHCTALRCPFQPRERSLSDRLHSSDAIHRKEVLYDILRPEMHPQLYLYGDRKRLIMEFTMTARKCLQIFCPTAHCLLSYLHQ